MDDPTFSVHRVVRSTLSAELAKHSAPVCLPAVELARLRKIEEAAQSVADGYDDSGAAWFCQLVTDLRTSLETETDV